VALEWLELPSSTKVASVGDGIGYILSKIGDGSTTIQLLYADVRDADRLPPDLLYAIRSLVQDCQSVLDWTMSEIHRSCVARPGKWSPYFPLCASPAKFTEALDKYLPGIRETRPDIAEALERHQPYRPGMEILGYLHKLSSENKHRQFSVQRLEVTESVHPWIAAGGSIETIPTPYGPVFDEHGVPIPGRTSPVPTISSITNFDWRFTDPDVSVLPTLLSLAEAVLKAVWDIRGTAGIPETIEVPARVIHPRRVLQMGGGGVSIGEQVATRSHHSPDHHGP
jgi:hypothetical protein